MPAKIKFSKKDEYETQFELDVDNGNISLANSLRTIGPSMVVGAPSCA